MICCGLWKTILYESCCNLPLNPATQHYKLSIILGGGVGGSLIISEGYFRYLTNNGQTFVMSSQCYFSNSIPCNVNFKLHTSLASLLSTISVSSHLVLLERVATFTKTEVGYKNSMVDKECEVIRYFSQVNDTYLIENRTKEVNGMVLKISLLQRLTDIHTLARESSCVFLLILFHAIALCEVEKFEGFKKE
ncbi:hypothetical protein L6452_23198 [Arctium lappa]|uniref:Uncharacterized protein n=1 Tax=Arctium lappa TaxID=4217 RepID=A0ACB9B1R2_ARCLA|nr:hypothetical protein L6452_23198 [Arctium lappa]